VSGILAALAGVLLLAVLGYGSWLIGVGETEALQRRTQLDGLDVVPENRLDRWDRRVRRTRWGARVHRRLIRAGVGWRVIDAVVVLSVAVAAVYLVAERYVSWWFAVLLASGVVFAARVYLQRQETRRSERFAAQLPEVARLLSNATSAGLALVSAIRMASGDLGEPAAGELRRLSEELDVGTPMNEALANLHERLPSRELSLLTRTLIIQARAGGAVVTALRGMSETLEARKDLRREIRTMLAGATYTGWVVLFLGVGGLVMLNSLQPGTLDRLTSSVLGQIGLVTCVVIYAVGFLAIRKTTKIEV
jgi:tight adherence protein B